MNSSLKLNMAHDNNNNGDENHSRDERLHPRSPRNRVGQGDRNSNSNNVEPTFAALRLTLSDLLYILKGYISQGLKHIRHTGPKILRNVLLIIGILVVLFMSMMMVLVIRFVQNEIRPLCSKPDIDGLALNNLNMDLGGGGMKMNTENSSNLNDGQPPLVEYYVHGRGNGHYARSVAIVEQLLNKGVDVRMFIGRATMWRAVNEAQREQKPNAGNSHPGSARATSKAESESEADVSIGKGKNEATDNNLIDQDEALSITTQPRQPRGEVTVTSIPSLLPTMGLWETISVVIERILSDCAVAKTTNRYPNLVISDGDLPGMLRAKYGSLPSVSVAHGQIFVIGQKPEWVKKDEKLNRAWNKQSRLNGVASWYSDWLIGTNFVDIPLQSQEGNGVIARSPMRPEVIRMGRERQKRTHQSLHIDMNMSGSGSGSGSGGNGGNGGGLDVLRDGHVDTGRKGGIFSGGGVHIEETFMTSRQKDAIDELLVGEDITSSLRVTRNAVETKQMSLLNDNELKMTRRKIVICYFRDKNGDLLTKALLRSGFDVILFERGFHKGLSDLEKKKYGQDLIVHRDRKVHHVSSSGEIENISLMDYWSSILRRYDRKLLVDDDELSDKDLNGNHQGDEIISEEEDDTKYAYTSKEEASIELRHALRNLNTLFKSHEDTTPRIIRVTDMSLFVPLLSIADGVASSAGSQLLSECIFSHLPVLALHREDDDEQMLNIAFSKHRYDRLSKEKQQAGNNENKMGHFANENVVHGMSLEKFEKLMKIIAMHDDNKSTTSTSSSNGKNHGAINEDGESDMFLSESEQSVLLRTKNEKEIYDEFKTFVEAVKSSPISWSYYHDLFHGIVDGSSISSSSISSKSEGNVTIGRDSEGESQGTISSVKNDEKEQEKKNDSPPEGGAGGDDEKYIDPFQGMPEVARVILEILDDLTKNNKQ